MNGFLSNTFRKFSLIDKIFQCLSITFLQLGNVLLKVSTNGKSPWVDGFSFSVDAFSLGILVLLAVT